MADVIERLRHLSSLTTKGLAPHFTGDMKFYVYQPETREAMEQAATELEALRKRCEAVEARVAMAMHVLDKIDAGLGGETDDVRDALDPEEAIAAAQEPSHG